MFELLSPGQMAEADRLTIEGGMPGIELMENAGRTVADTICREFPDARNILYVCGTGNNGGDGFVAARNLLEQGKDAQVLVCGDPGKISGDAATALAGLNQSVLAEQFPDTKDFDLVVDALFGAGLDRKVEGRFADVIAAINTCNKPTVAVDLPSGIDGRTGQVLGCAVRADFTITFFRKKPGHLLFPGRTYCGKSSVHQIGIKDEVLPKSAFTALQNHPAIWRGKYPVPAVDTHKYDRGHTLVLSGPVTATGAARLMAEAALRSGSGLVTLASPRDALAVNAANLKSVMLQRADEPREVHKILDDARINCVALGPGMPPDNMTVERVTTILETGRCTVLDAGALSAFAEKPDMLFARIKASGNDVFLTPHEGEFSRLFPQECRLPSKIERAQAAAETSGATIVLKGSDTVVATPDGQASVSDNAPPWLATAGSGDVLAGIVAGLAAQGMPPFEAANAAVWFHGDAANRLGPGMISSDLDEGLRQSIREMVLSVEAGSNHRIGS